MRLLEGLTAAALSGAIVIAVLSRALMLLVATE